jgi:hypothetical protein
MTPSSTKGSARKGAGSKDKGAAKGAAKKPGAFPNGKATCSWAA